MKIDIKQKKENNNMDIRKIGLVLVLIGIGTSIADMRGMITVWQMFIINITIMFIMATIVTILLYKIMKGRKKGIPYRLPDVKVIIPKAHVDDKLIIANSDIFKKNIIPTNPFRGCIFRIYIELKDPIEKLGTFIIRSRDSNTVEDKIDGKFSKDSICVINTIVRPNETLNFKFDRDIDVKKFMIEELYMP